MIGDLKRAAAFADIRVRLGKLVPRLASDHPGEVAATVAAIGRTLAGAGLDWHDMVARIAKPTAFDAMTSGAAPPPAQEPEPAPRPTWSAAKSAPPLKPRRQPSPWPTWGTLSHFGRLGMFATILAEPGHARGERVHVQLFAGMSGAGNWISNTLGSLGHGVANALGYGSDQDNLAKNRGLLAQLQAFDPVGNAPDIAALRQETARLEAKVAATDAAAAMRDREGRAIELSGKAGDAIRTLMPEVMRQRSAADTVELLRQTLADPLVMSHLDPGISGAMVGRAYSQASVLESMARPGVRERQDYEVGLSRIRDSGVQD